LGDDDPYCRSYWWLFDGSHAQCSFPVRVGSAFTLMS
jgi:hypothetical protein